MYCNVLKYLLIEELHPAITAGFDYVIDVSEDAIGITIQMSGFGEKLQVGIRFSVYWRSIISTYINFIYVYCRPC